eukprot:TRINITY_DN55745_c0_g2_i1.p1 TRINITY_DN55745_c0_g2~~TRINITY_DN55745_c0_g2_i1.p1  ORF type:complete len:617 (+),score=99.80 TRINITY_DN55745_c0_g2_i1:83-1933(+)
MPAGAPEQLSSQGRLLRQPPLTARECSRCEKACSEVSLSTRSGRWTSRSQRTTSEASSRSTSASGSFCSSSSSSSSALRDRRSRLGSAAGSHRFSRPASAPASGGGRGSGSGSRRESAGSERRPSSAGRSSAGRSSQRRSRSESAVVSQTSSTPHRIRGNTDAYTSLSRHEFRQHPAERYLEAFEVPENYAKFVSGPPSTVSAAAPRTPPKSSYQRDFPYRPEEAYSAPMMTAMKAELQADGEEAAPREVPAFVKSRQETDPAIQNSNAIRRARENWDNAAFRRRPSDGSFMAPPTPPRTAPLAGRASRNSADGTSSSLGSRSSYRRSVSEGASGSASGRRSRLSQTSEGSRSRQTRRSSATSARTAQSVSRNAIFAHKQHKPSKYPALADRPPPSYYHFVEGAQPTRGAGPNWKSIGKAAMKENFRAYTDAEIYMANTDEKRRIYHADRVVVQPGEIGDILKNPEGPKEDADAYKQKSLYKSDFEPLPAEVLRDGVRPAPQPHSGLADLLLQPLDLVPKADPMMFHRVPPVAERLRRKRADKASPVLPHQRDRGGLQQFRMPAPDLKQQYQPPNCGQQPLEGYLADGGGVTLRLRDGGPRGVAKFGDKQPWHSWF